MPDRRRTSRDSSAELGRSARRGLAQLGSTRIAITGLLLAIALMIAGSSWNLLLLRDAESALYDLRAANLSPAADTDKRITLVVYTADTTRTTGQISPVDRTVLAKALTEIDKLGPKGVAIDILFDSPQDDDPLLQASLKAMNSPVFLAFADARTAHRAAPRRCSAPPP